MAPVIEFYIPTGFQKRVKWTPLAQRGKVVEFPPEDPEDALDIPILSIPAPLPWPIQCQHFDTGRIRHGGSGLPEAAQLE
jgi:hypothetical protein